MAEAEKAKTAASASFEGVTFRGRKGVGARLTAVTLSLRSGVTALMGASGAGKTSLLNLLVGFETAEEGKVEREGDAAWVPSSLGLWPGYTARQHLEAVNPGVDALALLLQMDLEGMEDVLPARLSLGQQSRLAVARALASTGDWLVMDEPLVHVDPRRRPRFWEVIMEWRSARSLVFSAHEPDAVLAHADRVCCLSKGRLIHDGSVEDLYHSSGSEELAGFLGHANWFDANERSIWLGEKIETSQGSGLCVRPETLEVRRRDGDSDSPYRCLAYRRLGHWGESRLLHISTGEERRLIHRPNSDLDGRPGAEGWRVILQCLTCLWLLALLAACGGSTALPSLDVDEIQAWRLPIDGPKLPAPRSVAVGMEGEVVVLDDAGRVLVFSRVGELLRRWSMPEVSVGRPEGVVVLDDGAIVVCDTHYHRIMVFEPTGETRRTFGSNGRGPGEFIYPVAIAADDEQNLYIGEYGSNDRIQKFTREGRFLKSFGTFGIEPGQFQRPSGIAWHEGRLYVADAVNNRIQVFKDDGTFERELVIRADEGEGVLSLHLPYDLAIGPAETLFVVEYGAGRIVGCSLDGALIGVSGRQGSASGEFHTPWGIAVDGRGNLRVADTGNRRLVALRMAVR